MDGNIDATKNPSRIEMFAIAITTTFDPRSAFTAPAVEVNRFDMTASGRKTATSVIHQIVVNCGDWNASGMVMRIQSEAEV